MLLKLRGEKQMSTPVKELLGPRTKETNTILVPRTPRKTQQQTDVIAEMLVDKFQAPQYKNAFLKIAWRLDLSVIERHVASAFELGKNPRAYFISCCKNEMAKM